VSARPLNGHDSAARERARIVELVFDFILRISLCSKPGQTFFAKYFQPLIRALPACLMLARPA
jgi:hypothetical protein